MKKVFKSYISFTRTERIGLVCLCALLIILILIRATMSLWVHPSADAEQEKKLVTAWETFKRAQPKPRADSVIQNTDYKDIAEEATAPLPDIIDLNTADSATLIRLKGIGPVTAGKIVARRKKKGPYTDIEQLKEVGSFSAATFEVLKKHLSISH